MSTTLNFTESIPALGDAIVVKEDIGQVTRRYITAKNREHSTVEFTKGDGKSIRVPTHLIGPFEER